MVNQNKRNPAVIKPYFDCSVFEYGQDSDTDGLGRLNFIFLSGFDIATRIGKVQIIVESKESTFKKKYVGNSQGEFRSANLSNGMNKCTFEKEGFASQTFDDKLIGDENLSFY